MKILIDTNILIGLEDNKEIDADFSSFQNKCQSNNVQIYVHEASRLDIDRDKDNPRKAIILSKLAKFPEISGIYIPNKEILEETYGKISGNNDHVDVTLLYTLHENGAVDFLITQDRGLHKRAVKIGISNRVFKVEDALVWLRDKYERDSVSLPFIEEKQCHQINQNDCIFNSLQNDYDGFSQWFNNSCVKKHRDCWTINFENEIAGIAIRKDESFKDIIQSTPSIEGAFHKTPKKILKICTFKIKEKYRGEKFGEQLLKQILWWGHKNCYEVIYLTIYPKHKSLVDLLIKYGFESIGRSEGELYLAKTYMGGILKTSPKLEPLAFHRQYYPAFRSDEHVKKFLIPIHASYYETLFPENIKKHQKGLFDFIPYGDKTAGNTIRKVYVCHAKTKRIQLGDILLFFHLKNANYLYSQCLVTIGVVDGIELTKDSNELLRLTAKRSVFNQDRLEKFTNNGKKEVRVINFLLAGHINPVIPYAKLVEIGIKGPYQSIRIIDEAIYEKLKSEVLLHV